MPKPPSHPRYRAMTRPEPYPSGANRTGGGNNQGGHGHSERGSTGRTYHHTVSESTTGGVTPRVPPAQQEQSAALQNFGHGPNTGIGAGYGPGVSKMMNIQYGAGLPDATTITSTPRSIPRNFGQQSSPPSSSSSSDFGQSFYSLSHGPNQHNSISPSSVPNFQLTGYQHHQALQQPLQQPLQHHSLQDHHQQRQQQQHQTPSIANHDTHRDPNHFRLHFHQQQSEPQQPIQHHQPQSHPQPQFHPRPPLPNSPAYNPHPRSPGHNPTTPWTPQEDTLLLSLRASCPGRPPMPWSELQRLHFPGKSANACRKRHERLIEKRQAEEELDEERLAKIAGEYLRMRDQLWEGLAEKVGMSVQEVEERCMEWGVGGLRVGSRKGGRRGRQSSFPTVVAGMGLGSGMGSGIGMGLSVGVGGMLQGQGQQQHGMGIAGVGEITIAMGGDRAGEEAKNYTHSPVQEGSTARSPTELAPGPAPGSAAGNVGPGSGAGPGQAHAALNMLPPSAIPPLTTRIPISTTMTNGPASTGPGITVAPQMPPLPLTISPPGMMMNQHQNQPRVAFAGYLNGRSISTSRRQATSPMRVSSTGSSVSPIAPVTGSGIGSGSGGYQQPTQGQQQQWHQQQSANPGIGVGMGMMRDGGSFPQSHPAPASTARQAPTWHNTANPPSSFG